jgi:catechol 2,3-dioxygenase-like lactoylglutathione lyase family enzyme
MHPSTHLRVARPTDNLEEVARFYRDGLGFVELYRFENHEGFDGVMLGLKGGPYHLEFTRARGHRAGGRRPRTTSWCSIFQMTTSGIMPLIGSSKQGMQRLLHSTHTGTDLS